LIIKSKKTVFTNGCFDILHVGHIKYLEAAKKHGDFLIIGLNSDSSVRFLKGPSRPINTAYDRATILRSIRCVDEVIEFDEPTPLGLITSIRPDVLVKGGDYTKDAIVGADFVSSYGGTVIVECLIHGKSTTTIIEKIVKWQNL